MRSTILAALLLVTLGAACGSSIDTNNYPSLACAGVEAGIHYTLPEEHMHVGATLGAALGRLTYRRGGQSDADNACFCPSGAVTLGLEITRHVDVGAEAKFTWVVPWPGSSSEHRIAFTPSVQSTYRF
jgi:hypothetical protein